MVQPRKMDYVTLGRTRLKVSVMGLGAGGHSRLGQSKGKSRQESIAIVREALQLGVNFFDTAEAYGTEEIIGAGLKDVPRDQVIISTKKSVLVDGRRITAAELRQGLEASLKRLDTDYVDIYHLHAVRPEDYEYVREELVPEMLKLREEGMLRFPGITEGFASDTSHHMLRRALEDDVWDVVMVGFNIVNQSARQVVFPQTREQDVGVLIMFAVRRALSHPEVLREVVDQLIAEGLVDAEEVDREDPLGFLIHPEGAVSVADAAYRFCRYEPGVHVVLSGTGNIEHLRENAASLMRPPLPEEDRRRLVKIFERVDCVSGN